eukprot:scaffold8956_cov31-Phaeocystis_antarctica.AAC.5
MCVCLRRPPLLRSEQCKVHPAHAGSNRRAVRGRPRTRVVTLTGTGGKGTAVRSPYGTRPECGTRGISHPRNARVPAGAPPTIRSAAGVPGGRWGSVAYGWRAPRPPRVPAPLPRRGRHRLPNTTYRRVPVTDATGVLPRRYTTVDKEL